MLLGKQTNQLDKAPLRAGCRCCSGSWTAAPRTAASCHRFWLVALTAESPLRNLSGCQGPGTGMFPPLAPKSMHLAVPCINISAVNTAVKTQSVLYWNCRKQACTD